MKHWSRLLLPLGLGLLAATLNAKTMKSRLQPMDLIAVNQDIKAGDNITVKHLTKVSVSYPASHLVDHFFRWEDRHAFVIDVKARVNFRSGDLIPKSLFNKDSQVIAPIPKNEILVGLVCSEAAFEGHPIVLPGQQIKLEFDDILGPFDVAFCRVVEAEDDSDQGRSSQYELGVFLTPEVTQQDDTIRQLMTERVNRVIGITSNN